MNVPPALTPEGYEVHFAVNHIAHALLIKLLLPTLLRTAETPNSDVRIVSLTSQAFSMHPGGGIVFKDLRTTQGSGLMKSLRYGQSKLANILYAAELARRYGSTITAVCISPASDWNILTRAIGVCSPWCRPDRSTQRTKRFDAGVIVDNPSFLDADARGGCFQRTVGCYCRQDEDCKRRVLRARRNSRGTYAQVARQDAGQAVVGVD